MKNIFLPALFLSVSILTFFSCGNEEIDQSTAQSDFYQNLEGQAYIDYYDTPDVFFNFAKVDEETQMIKGWIIPTDGKVYTYEIPVEEFSVTEPILKRIRVERLTDIAVESDRTIDLTEVVDYYKKTRIAADGDFELGHGEPTAATSYYFIAYDLQLGNGACLNCPVSQVSRDEVAQLVLKADGTLDGALDSSTADKIIEWMTGIDESL